MANSDRFRYQSPFNSKAAVNSVKFGYDNPLLETELNEMQEIQNELRSSAIRSIMPSGFLDIVSKNFSGQPIIYQPVDMFNNVLNSIAIAPAKVIVNGNIINLYGNFSTDEGDGYLLIDLGDPPSSGTREDLVYLEVWVEKVNSSDTFPEQGYKNGTKTQYKIVDSRVGEETSWRTVLRYDVKVAHDVKFNLFPEGLGYTNSQSFSTIYAEANGSLQDSDNNALVFRSAADPVFKECTFYQDNNLYVAGRPDYTLVSNTVANKYIFALPMLRISRKNTQPYSLSNFNGARTSVFKYGDTSSAAKGDLLNNIRPDKIFYDIIDPSDVIDLRKTVLLNIPNKYYLDKSLKDLMTGNLQTKQPQSVRRVQFGREAVDYSENNGTILHVSFDDLNYIGNTVNDNLSGSLVSNETDFEPVYRDSVSGYGLYVDGRFAVSYDVSSLNSITGTIDIFMQPYWDGVSDTIQNIFQVQDLNGNPVFAMYKNEYQLIVDIYLSAGTANSDATVNQMVIDLTQTLMFSKQIYLLRFSWNAAPAIAKAFVYINGNVVGQVDYSGTALSPALLTFGNEDDATTYAGLTFTDKTIEEETVDSGEEDTSYTQIALEGETQLVEGEVFIDQNNQPIYTDKNMYVFIDESQLDDNEKTGETLSSNYIYGYSESDTLDSALYSYSLQEIELSEASIELDPLDETNSDTALSFVDSVNAYWTLKSEYDSIMAVFNEEDVVVIDLLPSTTIDVETGELITIEGGESTVEAEPPDPPEPPEIISRFVASEPLLTTEIDKIIADEARKQLQIDEEEYEKTQQQYEIDKIVAQEKEKQLENINYGFILEEVAVYKDSKEISTNDGMYHYTSNSYWPGIPNDFIANKALIYPSFNSKYRGYSDNSLIQNRTVQLLTGEAGVFILKAPYKYEIPYEPVIFHSDGQVNKDGELVSLPGTWRKMQDDWVFDASDTSLTTATVMYSMTIPKGHGGIDLPNEIIAAGFVSSTDIMEEVSFHRIGLTSPREVQYLNPAKVSADTDVAYDFSMTRSRRMAYARLLYYHVSGTGTNRFELPGQLYGYPIVNIISVTNRDIINVEYVPDDADNNPYFGFKSSSGSFIVTLSDRVAYGDLAEFVIALGGTTFDYETQTKTLVTNLYRTVLAVLTADGNRSTFTIPLGSDSGGIIHAANSVYIANYENDTTTYEYKFAAYVDNSLYPYRPIQNANGIDTNTWANQLADIEIEPTSWGTPFLKFTMSYVPPEGAKIAIPVLISYQPPKEKILSIWYKYVPYQGILGKATKKLKRLTEWKYFITTLSSGRNTLQFNEENTNSLNNIINRLPGGNSYASLITGSKIIFGTDLTNLDFIYLKIRDALNDDGYIREENLESLLYKKFPYPPKDGETPIDSLDDIPVPPVDNESEEDDEEETYTHDVNEPVSRDSGAEILGSYLNIEPYLKSDVNYELRFIKDVLFGATDNDFDSAFFELDTDMEVYKITTGFQDEKLNYNFNSFTAYLPDTVYPIAKYAGMACLVADEQGQILLFVIGCLNNGNIDRYGSIQNIIKPVYGDLFYINGRPTSNIYAS